MLHNLIVKLQIISNNIIFAFLSLFWKRDQQCVLLGSWFGDKFADNSRFLYLYLSQNKEKLGLKHVVWVSRNESVINELNDSGYEAYTMDSPESIRFHKKAKWHIICNSPYGIKTDLLTKYSYGTIRVNLWHGIGVVKRFGKASLGILRREAQHPELYKIIHLLFKTTLYRRFIFYPGGWGDFYLLSTTSITNKQFRESFDYIPDDHFIKSIYPRLHLNPFLLKNEAEFITKIRNHDKIILYLPTFRIGGSKFNFSRLPYSLQDILKQESVLWIQKAHSASNWGKDEQNDENIISLPPEFEINILLPYIKLLITDYSSVASDARYFNKSILFFLPDHEEYKNGENGLTAEAEELLDGPKFFDIDSLKKELPHYINDPESAKTPNYTKIRDKYWGDKKSISDVWDKISKL